MDRRMVSLGKFWETAAARDWPAHERELQAMQAAVNDFMHGRVDISLQGVVLHSVERVSLSRDLCLSFFAGGKCVAHAGIGINADVLDMQRSRGDFGRVVVTIEEREG